MSGRRKLPEPLSIGDAFWSSIVALRPDENGRERWERAAKLTGLSEDHLKKCAAGERPVWFHHAEMVDLVNATAGGPPTNEEAMRDRRLRALAGLESHGPEPARYMERVITDLSEIVRAVEFGKGDLRELRSLYNRMNLAKAKLLAAIDRREEDEETEESRPRRRIAAVGG